MSGKITAIKAQKRNPQRVAIYLDGEFVFGLSRLTAAWLQVGQELSDEKIAGLQAADEREVVFQKALRFLEHRPHSEAEVRRNLEKNGTPEEVVADVLGRLRSSGLVDDLQFAKSLVENRREFRPRSRRALSFELRQRGLPAEAIDQALSSLDESEEEELAYQAASKQARKLAELEWPEFRRKLTSFLSRRGFNYEVVAAAVKRAWNDREDHPQNESLG